MATEPNKLYNFLSMKNKAAIRKAWRAGKRTITIDGRKFNLERGRGKKGKPFILILPVSGLVPMGQIEIKEGSSSKLDRVKNGLKKAT